MFPCPRRRPSILSYGTIGVRDSSSFCSPSLNPWFITGLLDGEGSFVITIWKNPRYKTGCTVQAILQIKMHERDRPLILAIQNFWGIGYISKPNNSSTVEFIVSILKDIATLFFSFWEFPL